MKINERFEEYGPTSDLGHLGTWFRFKEEGEDYMRFEVKIQYEKCKKPHFVGEVLLERSPSTKETYLRIPLSPLTSAVMSDCIDIGFEKAVPVFIKELQRLNLMGGQK